jgi:hypothetical protein
MSTTNYINLFILLFAFTSQNGENGPGRQSCSGARINRGFEG